MKQSISAVIITKNEQENIERCILSLKGIADEILVIDSGSTDKTIEISEKLGALVIKTEWLGYAETKNLGNEKAKFNYILSLDADEEISKDLKISLFQLKDTGFKGAFEFNRLTNYCGKWITHSGWYPDTKTRLFDKRLAKWGGEFVHETLNIENGDVPTHIRGDLFHYSYKNKKEHIERTRKYALLSAKKMYSANKTTSSIKPFISATAKFIKMYILKLGFLDGKLGFQLARISSQGVRFKYSELNRMNKTS